MDEESTARSTIWQHVDSIGTCMMVTQTPSGMLARPMRGMVESHANAIWFFSDRDTEAAAQAKDDGKCCLTFADVRGQTFVSVSGELSLVSDRAEISRLWNEGASVYFPGGVDDQSMVLLRFTPESASYWDAPANPVVLAIKFLQAKATGKRPELGVQESVSMG